ncbi:unnamed protein product [Camellia sinensis]
MTATATTIDEILLVVGEEEDCLHMVDHNCTEWVRDTVVSYLATSHRDLFSSYNVGDFGTVRMGNSSYSKIVGIGDISIQTNIGHKLVLKYVRHVPDLRLNLISRSALDRQGYTSTFRNGRWKLIGGALTIAREEMSSTLYKTQTKICLGSLNAAEDKESPDLWHRRLAHMSEKGLHLLAKQSRIPLSKESVLNPCDHCLYGKQHRVSFSSTSKRKTEVLNLVYSDVCGPIEVESLGGRKYFLTFIDDASRKLWVYFLKTKDEVFQHFQEFHAIVERETGKKLKCLRTDNGGEYTSNAFAAYCASRGIRHETTVHGTSQHNGVAERMNRTIMERVRCMLRMAKLPKSFWVEVARTACYLINRSPSVPLNFAIPEEV